MEEGVWRGGNLSREIFVVLIYTVLFSSRGVCSGNNPLTGPEHKLYLDLFHSYNPESRPVKNASHSVVVTFALGLNQLLDLDEKNQVLTTSVWIYEEWYDEMLRWSPSKYDGQSALMIPATNIWLPDIFIFNTAGPNMNGFVNVSGSKVAIRHDGNVKWMIPLMVASACAVDVTYFPYDRQSCEIKFGSWIYDIDQVDILIDSDKPDLEHYVMNSEYDLENVSLSRGVLNSSCCPGDGQHPMVGFKINLRRKSLYYDYIVIAPTIMLCVMTLASFLLPCDRGEKMNIGLTVFLTLYVLQLRIADNVPDTNSTPILGVFMLVVMTFNCVSLIMATIVMNIKKLGDDSPCPDVPRWLFALCQHLLGRVVCTPYLWTGDSPSRTKTKVRRSTRDEIQAQSPDETVHLLNTNTTRNNTTTASSSVPNPADYKKKAIYQKESVGKTFMEQHHTDSRGYQLPKDQSETLSDPNDFVESVGLDEEAVHSFEGSDFQPNARLGGITNETRFSASHLDVRNRHKARLTDQASTGAPGGSTHFWPLYDQSPQAVAEVTTQQDQGAKGFLMKRRWFYVAEVVDKFLFVVYLVLLTCSIFTVLFLIPVYFRSDNS